MNRPISWWVTLTFMLMCALVATVHIARLFMWTIMWAWNAPLPEYVTDSSGPVAGTLLIIGWLTAIVIILSDLLIKPMAKEKTNMATTKNDGIRVKDMSDSIGIICPQWEALPKVCEDVTKGVFLVNVVRVDDKGEIELKGLGLFIERVRAACNTGHMKYRWAPIVSIKLSRKGDYERAMIAAYFESDKTREKLNEILSKTFNGVQPVFVEEGSLGPEL